MRPYITILFLLPLFHLAAQNQLIIRKTEQPIAIDGALKEAAWLQSDTAKNFTQYFPEDSIPADSKTEVYILYDEDYIYVAARMYNLNKDRDYVTPSLRRDYRGNANDGFTAIFDTFSDKTNAFMFGINPFGVRREGMISNGNDFGTEWDNVWYGESSMQDGYWVAEMAIPFKSLRFQKGQKSWNVNFYRMDTENAERSTWTPIPRNFSIANLAFTQPMIWENPTPPPGTNLTVIPYITGGRSSNYLIGETRENAFNAGFDVKYGVTPSLNLDLTVNPDFSQVEVDEQVTNLDRFEIFFPERRQFFIENADLFSSYGFSRNTPFFSRRIGVARDTATGQNIQNPIPFGARLSGKITNNTRVGLLSTQSSAQSAAGIPSYNTTVATVQQKVLNRSNVGIIMINNQAFRSGDETGFDPNDFNRVFGADFNLASADNKWTGTAFYHQMVAPGVTDSAFSTGAELVFNNQKFEAGILAQTIGANYDPKMGFVRRNGINQVSSAAGYNFFPKTGPVQQHGPVLDGNFIFNEQNGFLDYDLNTIYGLTFTNTSRLSVRWRREYVNLLRSFDPSGSGGLRLNAGTDYTYDMLMVIYNSDQRKQFFGNIYGRFGTYFNGGRTTLQGSMTYRYQPLGFASLDFSYNRIRLPDPYNDSNLILIGPRFDFTFSDEVFWTTFVQYNNQIDNLNINSRLQWRFKPVSDLFLVYTDNYFASSYDEGGDFVFFDVGQPKARAIVLKLSYWLNI